MGSIRRHTNTSSALIDGGITDTDDTAPLIAPTNKGAFQLESLKLRVTQLSSPAIEGAGASQSNLQVGSLPVILHLQVLI